MGGRDAGFLLVEFDCCLRCGQQPIYDDIDDLRKLDEQ
jgi:hypothetical protein